MAKRPAYSVSVNGTDVSARWRPFVTSISIVDQSGEISDTCTVVLDDKDAGTILPSVGGKLEVSLGWEGTGTVKTFYGTIDEVMCSGSRGQGRHIEVSAKSADMTSGIKEPIERHKDDATLAEAAQHFAPEGVTVLVHSGLDSVRRPYWAAARESFMAWGRRTAQEVGATFKIFDTTAVFVPRNAGVSASGGEISGVTAEWGRNMIEYRVAPIYSRPHFGGGTQVAWFNFDEAKHILESMGGLTGAFAGGIAEGLKQFHRFSMADKDSARALAASIDADIKRNRGGGTVVIDGDPGAQAEATCTIQNTRPGMDGTYRIHTVEHRLDRGGSYTTTLELREPADGAGEDDRSIGGTGNGGDRPLLT